VATYDASIKKALDPEQDALIKHKEHCSADPAKLATVGRELGHQIRIKRNDEEYGLYTVSEVREETPNRVVRMGKGGRERLGKSDEFDGRLDSRVPRVGLSDCDAETQGELAQPAARDHSRRGHPTRSRPRQAARADGPLAPRRVSETLREARSEAAWKSEVVSKAAVLGIDPVERDPRLKTTPLFSGSPSDLLGTAESASDRSQQLNPPTTGVRSRSGCRISCHLRPSS
jgi:hypothetical protein